MTYFLKMMFNGISPKHLKNVFGKRWRGPWWKLAEKEIIFNRSLLIQEIFDGIRVSLWQYFCGVLFFRLKKLNMKHWNFRTLDHSYFHIGGGILYIWVTNVWSKCIGTICTMTPRTKCPMLWIRMVLWPGLIGSISSQSSGVRRVL